MKHVLIAFSLTLVAAAGARADVIPPDVDACKSRQVGDACTHNGSGKCQQATCTRVDYMNWTRSDGGPPTMQYACLKCAAEGQPLSTDGGASRPDAGTGEKKDESSGCSVGGLAHAARPVGPWILAGAFSALFLVRRRRR